MLSAVVLDLDEPHSRQYVLSVSVFVRARACELLCDRVTRVSVCAKSNKILVNLQNAN